IVLNPLGVPSRMNVGQILETHLGWACSRLGKKISTALEGYRRDNNITELKTLTHAIYGDDATVASLDDEQLVEMAGNLEAGVPIATPVFDGAHESDIVDMLELSGVDRSGQSIVFDGRTGEQFDRKVTVGYIYMLKLH